MKKILLLFILFLVFSCNDNDENDITWGYACIDSNCIEAVHGPYENFENCINLCSSTQNKD
ncbi:MAG: hypothetical protein CMP56_03930 [Flavobacteriales bacterium]|nr:hypothetical protein [Flavobacteriales bacterium]